MKQMHERNQPVVAIVGTIAVVLLILLSLNLGKIPGFHPQTSYHADFANADGLTAGTQVRIAGVQVGSVTSVVVQGDHVHVGLEIKSGIRLASATRASIEIATVLGEQFVQLETAGPGRLHSGATIPTARTTVPYTLIDALSSTAQFTNKVDLNQLQASLKTLSGTLNGITPGEVTQTLTGLATISNTIANNQNQITAILANALKVTNTLNANSTALTDLITNGDTFLQLLENRHAVIAQLLSETASLGAQVKTLIQKNGAQLTPLLNNLNSVGAVLAKNETAVQQSIITLGQFSINITNATGSGPWLDLLLPYGLIPDNVIKACGQNPTPLCGSS